jgi:hypothetical protein
MLSTYSWLLLCSGQSRSRRHRELLQAPDIVRQTRETVAVQHEDRERSYGEKLGRQALDVVEL